MIKPDVTHHDYLIHVICTTVQHFTVDVKSSGSRTRSSPGNVPPGPWAPRLNPRGSPPVTPMPCLQAQEYTAARAASTCSEILSYQ